MSKRGRRIVISGPAGVGKSLLLETLERRASRRGFQVGHGVVEPGARARMPWPWPRVLRGEEGIESGAELLLNIDVQGARLVRDSGIPCLVTVFIDAPSEEELQRRLTGRAADSEEDIRQRLEIARSERKEKSAYQHIVVNDDLDRAVQELEALLEAPIESN